LIADSESTRQDAIRILQILPDKIVAVQLGVDLKFRVIDDSLALERVRREYKLPDRFILYVGLVEPRKNVSLLIRAYKNLVDQEIATPLVIVGRFGWMSSEIFDQIERLGLQERVQFTGYVPADDLPCIYNLASLFVYPTRYEGFGFPALEAMACGVPLITSAVSSLPEIVGDAGSLSCQMTKSINTGDGIPYATLTCGLSWRWGQFRTGLPGNELRSDVASLSMV
jgi:glycosyltransferase involved in cell wall biosynthesis